MTRDKNYKENNLSDYDAANAIRDAHNRQNQSFDVTLVNDLVPDRYDKVTYEFIEFPDGTCDVQFVNFWGKGTRQKTRISVKGNPEGTKERTVLNFQSQTSVTLDGKYFIIYDDIGSVGVWFDVDNSSIPPTTGALRDIEIDIVTGDSFSIIAEKVATVINSDSKFSAASLLSSVNIESSTIGNKPDATQGTTNIIISSITNGTNTLNNKYFVLYSANDAYKFHVWYNLDGTGVDPDPFSGNSVGIEIPVVSGDSEIIIAEKTAEAIDANEFFNCTYCGDLVFIETLRYGQTTETIDGDTDHHAFLTEQVGSPLEIVSKIEAIFDDDYVITEIERII